MSNRIIKADPDAVAPFSPDEKESHLKSFVTAASVFSSRMEGPLRKRGREEDTTDSHRAIDLNPNQTTHASPVTVPPSAQPGRPAFAPRYPKAVPFEATEVIPSRLQRPLVPRFIPRNKRVPYHIPAPRRSFMPAPSPRILPPSAAPPHHFSLLRIDTSSLYYRPLHRKHPVLCPHQ